MMKTEKTKIWLLHVVRAAAMGACLMAASTMDAEAGGCNLPDGTVLGVDIASPAENDVYLKGQEVRFDGTISPAGRSGLTYAWSVLQGTCDPSSATTEDFQATLKSEGTIEVKLVVTVDGTNCVKTRTVKAVLPEVTKLRWNDDIEMTEWEAGRLPIRSGRRLSKVT